MEQSSWQDMKCGVCGAQPEKFAQDLREVPSENIFVRKVALQNWRAGVRSTPGQIENVLIRTARPERTN